MTKTPLKLTQITPTGVAPPVTPPLSPIRGTLGQVGGSAALPCLYSNISITNASDRLSTQVRKAASALAWNVSAMAEKWGLERLGFLTLTFADHVTDIREAQRRFNSLQTNVIKPRYPAWLGVWERQKSGRIHFHLLVVMLSDIRTGFDWDDIARGKYTSASPALRSEWAFWRRTAKAYRFGRTELLPIRSTDEGIGRYVGKYIGKHHGNRVDEDKGARLVRYSRGARMATTRFAWATPGAAAWRNKVKRFAQIMAKARGCPPTMNGLAAALGPRWAYNWREFILALPDEVPLPKGKSDEKSSEIEIHKSDKPAVIRCDGNSNSEDSGLSRGYEEGSNPGGNGQNPGT